MPTLRFTPAALDDLERLAVAASLILDGSRICATHPLIGKPLEGNRRELLVFRGRAGYVAQYAFIPARDEVVVLAVSHQPEVS